MRILKWRCGYLNTCIFLVNLSRDPLGEHIYESKINTLDTLEQRLSGASLMSFLMTLSSYISMGGELGRQLKSDRYITRNLSNTEKHC